MNSVVSLKDVVIKVQDKVLLQGVNLDVAKGEFCYLTGKSGSGKSSLLKAMHGAIPMDGREALVVGQDLLQLNVQDLPAFRRKVGFVFQDFRLFPDKTARANLYMILKATGWSDEEVIRDRIMTVLEQVGLTDQAKAMPHEMSGGEQQRLSVARALLNEPTLILADEPTGNLDPETSSQIIRLLRDLSRDKGVSVICATHDVQIIEQYPSLVYVCENQGINPKS